MYTVQIPTSLMCSTLYVYAVGCRNNRIVGCRNRIDENKMAAGSGAGNETIICHALSYYAYYAKIYVYVYIYIYIYIFFIL